MAAFGEVQTIDPEQSTGQSQSAAPEAPVIDINDPAFTSEVLTDNPEGDAYAVLPPLPDGKWRAKIKGVDIKDSKGQPQRFIATIATWDNNKPFLCTNVESTILDSTGKFDGFKLTDYWVKTLPNRSGTSPVATILRKLGVDLSKTQFRGGLGRFTQGELMDTFLQKLAGEPELVVETAWDASCATCQEAAKKAGQRAPKSILIGMHRFPTKREGGVSVPDPVISCPVCKGSVRAQVRIVQYHDLATAHNK